MVAISFIFYCSEQNAFTGNAIDIPESRDYHPSSDISYPRKYITCCTKPNIWHVRQFRCLAAKGYHEGLRSYSRLEHYVRISVTLAHLGCWREG